MIGRTVTHYRIVGRLGVGGMGVVYDAHDERLSRRVALKFLADELADDPDASRRLRREAQIIALLNHPNICTVYDIDVHEGRTFIAMERLDGVTLKLHMARRQLATAELVAIALQVAAALDAAHGKGVIHRDIKPGNVFVGEDAHVKVLDFGLARRLTPAGEVESGGGLEGSTIPGRPIGTPSYMAPERILQLPLDARSDLFSLGVVMYEMATGRLPFTGASPGETVANILDKAPEPLSRLSPDRPAGLDRTVSKLLAKDPSDRFASAAALRAELGALEAASGPTFLRRLFGKASRRKP